MSSDGVLVPLPSLDEHGRGRFDHEGRSYAVFTIDGQVVVLDGACPHKGGPLAEGIIRDGAVVCPWHWYAFDLVTGACANAEAEPAERYPVIERDGVRHALIKTKPTLSWAERLRAHATPEKPS